MQPQVSSLGSSIPMVHKFAHEPCDFSVWKNGTHHDGIHKKRQMQQGHKHQVEKNGFVCICLCPSRLSHGRLGGEIRMYQDVVPLGWVHHSNSCTDIN